MAWSTSRVEAGLSNWVHRDWSSPHTSPENRSTSVDRFRATAGRGARLLNLSTPMNSARDLSASGSLLTCCPYCCSSRSCSMRRCASSRVVPVIVTLVPSARSTVMAGSWGRVARHDAMDTPREPALMPLPSTSDTRSKTAPCCPGSGTDDDAISTRVWRRIVRSRSNQSYRERTSSSAELPAICNVTRKLPPPLCCLTDCQHRATEHDGAVQPIMLWKSWLQERIEVGRCEGYQALQSMAPPCRPEPLEVIHMFSGTVRHCPALLEGEAHRDHRRRHPEQPVSICSSTRVAGPWGATQGAKRSGTGWTAPDDHGRPGPEPRGQTYALRSLPQPLLTPSLKRP